jgi:hypothetical protein
MAILGLGRARPRGLADEIHTVSLFSFQLLSVGLVQGFGHGVFRSPVRRLSTAALLGLAGLCASATGCEDRREALPFEPPPAAPTPELARALRIDAGEIESPVDPPAPPGDLKADIERFTTVDDCVAERAHLDPLLGDALEAIGYDTFLRDACHMIDAAKAVDPGRCATIDSSALATQCRATVAQVAGMPDVCPWEAASRPARGREAKCVALASRDIRLCAGADGVERATCEATLSRDERRCSRLRAVADQSRCRRDAARWADVLADPVTMPVDGGRSQPGGKSLTPPAPFASAGVLHVEPSGEVKPGALPLDLDLTADLARGVVLVETRDGAHLTIGPADESGLDFIAPSPFVRASLSVDLVIPAAALAPARGASRAARPGEEIPVRIVRAELLLPGHAPMASSGTEPGAGFGHGASTGASSHELALVGRVGLGEPVYTRGAPLAFTIDGDFAAGGSRWHVHTEGTTFVRDVVKARDLSVDPSGLGVSQGMR